MAIDFWSFVRHAVGMKYVIGIWIVCGIIGAIIGENKNAGRAGFFGLIGYRRRNRMGVSSIIAET